MQHKSDVSAIRSRVVSLIDIKDCNELETSNLYFTLSDHFPIVADVRRV
jgi:hypothetical protein